MDKKNQTEILAKINEWLVHYKMEPVLASDLPKLGVMVWDETDSLMAAGFIRRCEGNVGWIDSLIADPKLSWPERSEAIDQVVAELIEQAKIAQLDRIIAFTVNKRTLMRSEKFGFMKLPHTVMTLSLGKESR